MYEQDRLDVSFKDMVGAIKAFSGIAITSDEGSISYAELDAASDRQLCRVCQGGHIR